MPVKSAAKAYASDKVTIVAIDHMYHRSNCDALQICIECGGAGQWHGHDQMRLCRRRVASRRISVVGRSSQVPGDINYRISFIVDVVVVVVVVVV
jgi:hypothetical protein